MGWCRDCVLLHHPELSLCENCNAPFPKKNNNKYCKRCMFLNWIEKHIDSIEEYMAQGLSFTAARHRVTQDIRPECVSCGAVIKSAKPGSLFCTTNETCRTKLRRFRRLLHAGVSREEALGKVLDQSERDPNHLRAVSEG